VTEVAHIELRPRNIGSRIKRVEDPRLLIGQGMFTDDRTLPGTLHIAFLRSIHAHALISHIDAGRAAEMPGVVGIYTAEDLEGLVDCRDDASWPGQGFRQMWHISGARAAYERFALYQPRTGGPLGFTSGPKVAHFDRVEWLTLDPFSAMAALHAGEIDWWELPPSDLIGQLAHDRDVTVIAQYATAMGILRFNHLRPPPRGLAVSAASFDVATRVKATPSSPDSPLERAGFELPVPRGRGFDIAS